MIPTVQILVFLLAVVATVAVVAARLRIPDPILLVLTGVGLAFVPGLTPVELAPELVLLLVLPPVIYVSAVTMSWREVRLNLGSISLLAVGCVLFTTVATAAAAHWLLGLSWPIGFVLGAIVSPPDTMAPISIARHMGIPRRILIILEGEGLANDATALILYRFAVAATSAGMFALDEAVAMFLVIVVGEVLWGIAVGWVMLRLRHWVADPRIEITLSVLTPFLAYWPPEHLGGSGVLATVTTGLYAGWMAPRLMGAATRLQGLLFWDSLIYAIEGMVFLITGLQARVLVNRSGSYRLSELVFSALIVSAVVILARFVWTYPAAYLPVGLKLWIRPVNPLPTWQGVFAVSFTGVRGIVSLAAALALPLALANGAPFPDRDLILLLTFSVIMVTLVGQGLILPLVVRALGLISTGRHEQDALRAEEYDARRRAIEAALDQLDRLSREGRFAAEIIQRLRAEQQDRLRTIRDSSDRDVSRREVGEIHGEIELALIGVERHEIDRLFRKGSLNGEGRRRIERELDLREAHILTSNERPEA
jgi:monovalent cation/hydrogen antiporter